MMHPVRRAGVAIALLLAASCSGADDSVQESANTEAATDSTVQSGSSVDLDVDLGGVTTADVFAPAGDGTTAAPIVVMLHGTSGDRTRLHDLARRVADDGVLVVVLSSAD